MRERDMENATEAFFQTVMRANALAATPTALRKALGSSK